jgi:BirA family biotin operon repressor/biotin-[acetyl-CoA-carboxylase] ligase
MSELPGSGDKFIESGDLSSHSIIAGLRSDFWKEIICYESVDSTNELALALALTFPEAGAVVIADSQTKGRGRLGRTWISPPGCNIYMSALLAPAIALRDAALLTVASTLACAGGLRNKTGLDVKIKWPNDLMVDGKKVGGILTEVRSLNDKIKYAAIGIGVNVNARAEDFPAALRSSVTSVADETGRCFSRSEVISELLNNLELWYRKLLYSGRFPLLEAWRKISSTIGKGVRVTLYSEVLSGFAEDIDDSGMLILRLPSGERRKINSGDLTELR